MKKFLHILSLSLMVLVGIGLHPSKAAEHAPIILGTETLGGGFELYVGVVAEEQEWDYLYTEQGVELYSARQQLQEQVPFKAIARVQAPYQEIVKALVDHEQKPTWSPKLKQVTIHQIQSSNRFAYSEYYTTPWPFYDREFLLDGKIRYTDSSVIFEASNLKQDSLADSDHVLVNIVRLSLEIIPLSPDESQVTFVFSGDMGGWIPNFVKTIIQRKWPIRFLQALENHILTASVETTDLYNNLDKRDLSFPGS